MNAPSTWKPPRVKPRCADCARRGQGPFCGLSSGALAGLDARKAVARYARGQILFHEGGAAQGAYCVRSGLVKVYRLGANGRAVILRVAGPGEIIGFHALLSQQTHTRCAEALTESEICFLPADSLRPLFSQGPPLVMELLGILLAELEEVEERFSDFCRRKADERLAIFLLECCGKIGGAGSGEVVLPLSRQEIADCVAAAPETVIRGLRRLGESGLIRVKGRSVKILRRESLLRKLR